MRKAWALAKFLAALALFAAAIPVLPFRSFPAPAGIFAWAWAAVGFLVLGAELAELLGLVRDPFADLEAAVRGGVRPFPVPRSARQTSPDGEGRRAADGRP
ncbi:hypothetical protein [Brockia lithotrophica]|uniref:Uncharacterized protein n=1 Tax=Brockia lithotrophica TaxID=933949 RepID=A0A660KUK3_9BACL|nr:hypothetical protein [Brockia lithotrophica]RKQ84663.1 hypothetical protein C7438_1152 [Brockia lithotrophica]